MVKLKNRLIEQYSFYIWSTILIVSIVAGLQVVEQAEKKRFLENQRESVVEHLSTIRTKLESVINSDLLLARTIIIEVETNTEITNERFLKIAQHFFNKSSHIRNIGLAKGTVLSYVYPIKGNEKAIGLDYKRIPSQWPAVLRTIKGRKTVVAGPVNLVQGGIGIIGRTPIFVEDDRAGSEIGKYFGILSVVIDMPSMMESAGLNNQNSLLKISIRGKDGLGAKGELFYGSDDAFTDNPVLTDVMLPGGGTWQMAATPVGGWATQSPDIIYYRLTAIAVSLAILLLLFIQHRETEKRKKSEEKRIELIMELQKALLEVKTLKGFLPICSHCKKIRDDKGYWNQIESYLNEHSDAEFSHGICPECAKKHYPDLDLYDDDQNKE